MPTFSFPADLDDPDAHPEAGPPDVRARPSGLRGPPARTEGRQPLDGLSPEPSVLTPKTGFPPWNELIRKLTATVETELARETFIGGLQQALDKARRAQERRNRLIHDMTGLDLGQDPPVVVRLEWDPTVRRRCEVTETIEAIRAAVDDLTWAVKNLGHQTGKLRDARLLHNNVAANDCDCRSAGAADLELNSSPARRGVPQLVAKIRRFRRASPS